MQANYKNIGLIADAEIELNGITVIAAPNNSGKSSLSKTLYMFLETLNSFQEEYANFRNEIIGEELDIFFRLLNRKLTSDDKQRLLSKFTDKISGSGIDNLLEIEFDHESDSMYSFFSLGWFRAENRDSILRKNIEIFRDTCYEFNIDSEEKDTLEKILSYFGYSQDDKIKSILKSKIRSYFDNDLVSRDAEKAYFSLLDNQSEFDTLRILECNLDAEDIVSLRSQPSLNEFRNILYLDSFVDLENYNLNNYFRNLSSRHDIRGRSAATFQSLIEFRSSVNPLRTDIKSQDLLLLDISQIIEGSVERSSNENIVYTKKHQQFNLKNTATGIKMFGVLQLLLRNYQMTSDLFLIIDEPETNLHPVWQVKLAEIIVLLNKRLGTRFMINSHSSNFIEGIKLYSELYDCDHQVEFYLINPLEKERHSVKKVTTNIQLAYDQLNGSLDLLDEVSERILNKNREN